MIENLIVKNYQSHKNTEITFSKGVNIIIGTSDYGKSVLIRALYWLANNKPDGTSFMSDWGGDTIVQSKMEGNIITRYKTKTKNQYRINDDVFDRVGTSVPDSVKEIVNMDSLNFQLPLDSPFLLSKNSSEVSKYINSIINFEIIDTTMTNVLSLKRKTAQKISYVTEEIKQLHKKKEEILNIEDCELIIKKAENIEKKINISLEEKEKLSSLYENISSQIKKISFIKEYSEKEKQAIEQALFLLEKIKKIKNKFFLLEKTLSYVDKLSVLFLQKEQRKLYLEKEYKKIMPEKCPLCGK